MKITVLSWIFTQSEPTIYGPNIPLWLKEQFFSLNKQTGFPTTKWNELLHRELDMNMCNHSGVSDHHKASPDSQFFWKHQCALMYHNIFMKRIGPIIFILNHSEIFFWRTFSYGFCGFLEFFLVWKSCFWIFIKKNFFFVRQIFKYQNSRQISPFFFFTLGTLWLSKFMCEDQLKGNIPNHTMLIAARLSYSTVDYNSQFCVGFHFCFCQEARKCLYTSLNVAWNNFCSFQTCMLVYFHTELV